MNINRRSLSLVVISVAAGVGAYIGHKAAGAGGAAAGACGLVYGASLILRAGAR